MEGNYLFYIEKLFIEHRYGEFDICLGSLAWSKELNVSAKMQ